MSAYLDAQVEDPYYTQSVGPQSDGTYGTPASAVAVTPYDAGGGPAKNYSPQILDIFKFGIGVWQQQSNQTAMLDYRRFEATQAGLQQQGRANGVAQTATGGVSGQLILFAVLALGVILIAKA